MLKAVTNIIRFKSIAYDVVIKEVDKLFSQAIGNARMSGKIVAIALALGFPFSTQTVSLIGFSLGT
jgi:stage V sporulation protein SpoVS